MQMTPMGTRSGSVLRWLKHDDLRVVRYDENGGTLHSERPGLTEPEMYKPYRSVAGSCLLIRQVMLGFCGVLRYLGEQVIDFHPLPDGGLPCLYKLLHPARGDMNHGILTSGSPR